MAFPSNVKIPALVACGRHCCICHKFCGKKMELHHIKPPSDGGKNTFENCIPLCFDCHSEMSPYDIEHPKGTKYSREELIQHRNHWYAKVKANPSIPQLPEHLELDRGVYRKLIELLPWNGSISFICKNNFAGFGFRLDELNSLDKFELECQNPAFEFIDADLEGGRADLLEKIEQFLRVISLQTYPTGVSAINTVPPEWEIEQPERFGKTVGQLHELAAQICECYDSFIRMGRRKLGIE
jgi:hypothetical protein